MSTIGIIHIGTMGYTLGDALVRGGHDVISACDERSEETQARAKELGAREVGTIEQMAAEADAILGVHLCSVEGEMAEWSEELQTMVTADGSYPKAIRFPILDELVECNFKGIFVDANWIHPTQYEDWWKRTDDLESYVECGIYGYPVTHEYGNLKRFLWLSGEDASTIGGYFEDDPAGSCKPIILPDDVHARIFKEESADSNTPPADWGQQWSTI
jgi:Predicted dinucleotide-binding enzymes